jgi:hypothetical protein
VACVGVVLHVQAPDARSAQAIVRIAPGGNAQGKRPVLTFFYDDNNIYDPQVCRVRVARVGAVGDAWLWKEWLVGSKPRGFKLVHGDALTAGVYEISSMRAAPGATGLRKWALSPWSRIVTQPLCARSSGEARPHSAMPRSRMIWRSHSSGASIGS